MSREPDPLWDVMDELFGFCRTRQEASRRGRAVKELREAGATVEEVRTTYAYCKRFPSFTEMAIVGHLSAALHAAQKPVDSAIDRILGGQ
jgi:hypothetical protein